MNNRDDYGFPVEDRFVAVVVEMTERYGFAVMDGNRMRFYFNLKGERTVEKIDGVCEWRHLQNSRTEPLLVGAEIVFDKVKYTNQVDYWCLREDFDKVYVARRRPESTRCRQFAFGYR